jgi:hypothetical protein
VARTRRANRLVTGVDQGTPQGERRSPHHRGPHGQWDAWPYPRDGLARLHLTSTEKTSDKKRTVAGRAVYRGRMGHAPCLELDRSTPRPLSP